MKSNKIDITIGTVKYERSKLSWISISKDGLFYISWPTGRMYFKTDSDNFKKVIRNITFDDSKCLMSFTWKGQWELSVFGSGKTKLVTKVVKIKFDKKSNYQYAKKKME